MTAMWVLITYDVSTRTPAGRSRLRKVANTCQDYGQRVQKSVFECTVNDVTFHLMKSRLLDIIDEEQDSIRFYKLPEGRDKRVEEYGQSNVVDFTGPSLGVTRTHCDRTPQLRVRVHTWTVLESPS